MVVLASNLSISMESTSEFAQTMSSKEKWSAGDKGEERNCGRHKRLEETHLGYEVDNPWLLKIGGVTRIQASASYKKDHHEK